MEIDEAGAGCEIQDEDQVMIQEEHIRSYECTFCKRGFTNAQALGGHMNIHRKDKAKMKQSASSSSLSMSSNKMPVDDISKIISTPARLPWVIPSTTTEGRGRGEDRGEITSSTMEETLKGKVRQLQLFEKSSNMDQKFRVHQVLPLEASSDQKMVPPFQHGSTVSELDLELRLGPEPQNSTPSSTPTGCSRHFF